MPLVDYWTLVVLQRYAKFDGRASRAEYWWFYLANFIVLFGAIVDIVYAYLDPRVRYD